MPKIILGEQAEATDYKAKVLITQDGDSGNVKPEPSEPKQQEEEPSKELDKEDPKELFSLSVDERLDYLGLDLSEINSVNDDVLRKIPDEVFDLPLINMYPEAVMAKRDLINDLAESSGISRNLIAILMTIESKGDPNAKSGAGAYGLFQVTEVAMQDLVKLPPGHIAHDAKALDDFYKLRDDINNGKSLSDEQLRRHGELALKYWLRCLEFAKNRLKNRGVSNYNKALLYDLAAASYNGGPQNLINDFTDWPTEMQNYLRLVYKGLVLAVLNYDPDGKFQSGIIFDGSFNPTVLQ